MRSQGLIGLILIQTIFISTSYSDATLDEGRKLAGQCKICHGSQGIAQIPIAPNIAGEPKQYIVEQLNAFRTGQRQHEMMSVVAKNLDDKSIELLALWYSSQHIQVEMNNPDADHTSVDGCIECHGINGVGTSDNVPHLAGESIIYIDTQLKAFRFDKRKHEVMSGISKQMSDEDIRKAAEWYSAISIEVADQ